MEYQWDQQDEDGGQNNQQSQDILVQIKIQMEDSRQEREQECELNPNLACSELYKACRILAGFSQQNSSINIRITHDGEQLPDDQNKNISQHLIKTGSILFVSIEMFGGFK